MMLRRQRSDFLEVKTGKWFVATLRYKIAGPFFGFKDLTLKDEGIHPKWPD